ncbi:MAG: hypothetical protein A2750_02815 [Candidatus Yanofskybacteria bacterium RIFCSPHIGHO2_01_FULL_45_42]|uniref:Transcription elongation factor GreA n=3 Tax=Candidatus Yanofskyibacteriota TaxID=1752733 RepID=A0A1F8F5H2_9BACT|nr:MAG: hypothetical protein A2750_02815 [Candidatus Yanofskybacteria bacterium RIFCSPHIGHO2_01_FULL_45_42]OGN15789.1 MAG: hypothetical protein A3C81_01760 [Candidatus Yanofskybacteria bacterium RIFCSPHIGHO2_02_FULL_46_19]OGN26957.1 MAG: hypothetical protein A3B17_01450 [Candidatus Yanofskybacteria bacterium RIFCSPLOWO2_01_FULL_45_72]OGN31564.1 MAG: hypothetical protein A3J01_02630 [Candidatus Yanofskybacteria bacterium RIFCSPLOWO2_02_FULL_45_18]
MSNQYFSREGLEKLKMELEERTSIIRPELARRIQDAKELGDLSENAEFDAAKKEQEFNEGRIEDIRNILDSAIVISGNTKSGIVSVGSCIQVDSKNGNQHFTIVGSSESNPADGFISNESPLGKSFLGHKKGDLIVVTTPRGDTEYKIIEIT